MLTQGLTWTKHRGAAMTIQLVLHRGERFLAKQCCERGFAIDGEEPFEAQFVIPLQKQTKAITSQRCEPAKVTKTDKMAMTKLASYDLTVMTAPRIEPRVASIQKPLLTRSDGSAAIANHDI
jgi:hypothetical protein